MSHSARRGQAELSHTTGCRLQRAASGAVQLVDVVRYGSFTEGRERAVGVTPGQTRSRGTGDPLTLHRSEPLLHEVGAEPLAKAVWLKW